MNHRVAAGILLLVATLTYFSIRFLRAPKRGAFRAWGWAGLAIILVSEFLLFRGVARVATFFTPVAWTGYLLLADALVSSLSGTSRLSQDPRGFLSLAFWSVPLWLIFEAYNLRLENWTYVGLPENRLVYGVGYTWSFATIWPALYETADFVRALGRSWSPLRRRSLPLSRGILGLGVLGVVTLALPVLLPRHLGPFLFGPVWIGFVLLLDPINYRWNGRSLLGDWEAGETSTLASFLTAGWICGLLWEFWNYWALSKWTYTVPYFGNVKIFEMPVPGYLGFPPFAVECWAMYVFLRSFLASRGRSPLQQQSEIWFGSADVTALE
jgi:hypothetical protein